MPRAAIAPPSGGKRFTLVVEGPSKEALLGTWSSLCQEGPGAPSADFLAVYPFLSTVSDNKFRFSGGNQTMVRESLTRLLQKSFGQEVQVTAEV